LGATLGLSSAAPCTPGYTSVYQFVTLVPLGSSCGEALVHILVRQLLNYLVVNFWSLPGLYRLNGLRDASLFPAEGNSLTRRVPWL
jgi:hypothetical protein